MHLRRSFALFLAFAPLPAFAAQPVVPPQAEKIHVLPAPIEGRLPGTSIFGVCGHMLHTDAFYPKFDRYWRPQFTLPLVVNGRFGIVREPLYQTMQFFVGPDATAVAKNRKAVEDYLASCQQAGVKVILTPMFSSVDDKTHGQYFEPFFDWIAGLARGYPCVKAVEMHNEPNLKFFWGHSPEAYAAACRKGAGIIKARSPETPIIVGSISSLWWEEGVKFLERAMEAGLLDSADGVSVHPYRTNRPPEADPHYAGGTDTAIRDFWTMVQKHNRAGRPLKLYFTEVGYSSGTTGQQSIGSKELQADYLSRLMLIFLNLRTRGLPIEAACWYDLKCDGKDDADGEASFGLVSHDTLTLRPAYLAYRRIAETFENPADFEPLDLTPAFGGVDGDIRHLAWRRKSDGAILFAFWRTEGESRLPVAIKLPLAWKPARIELHDLREDRPRPIGFTHQDKTLFIPMSITSRAAWMIIRGK